MAALGIKDFGSKVVGRTADSSLLLSLVEDLSCQAKVTDLQAHSLSEEQITELEVTVNDLARVDVFLRLDELVNVVSRLDLVESLATADEI